ncbi:MAG: hypothetical protein HQM11_07660 [SAR324 cluster bacterium]|nr:hypothetical protein [SAR324 cluster bacterium]
MTLIKEIADYISTKIAGTVLGMNLFADLFPEDVSNCTMITEIMSKGIAPELIFSRIYITTRNESLTNAHANSRAIASELHHLKQDVLTNYRVNYVICESGPIKQPEVVTINGKKVFAFITTFIVYYEEK